MEMWKQADEALLSIRVRKAKMNAEELRWLAVARREKAHEKCGFAFFYNYIRNRLGVGKKTAFDYQRIAIALTELPAIAAALAEAKLTFSGVRELTRVATPETETRWLDEAAGQPPDVIEGMVSGRIRGDLPETPARPEEMVKTRTFELRNETDALLRQAKLLIEKELNRTVSDDEFLAELAREKIAAIAEGKKRKPIETKVVCSVCPECESARQLGGGKWIAIPPSTFDGLDFDEVLTIPSQSPQPGTASSDIPAWVKREVFIRDGGCCRVPGCASKHNLHFHHIIYRENGGSDEPSNVALICGGHHRAIHCGNLLIWGDRQDALEYYHRDGTRYGALPQRVDGVAS